MSTELAIIKQGNIQLIVSAAPESFRDNTLSRDRCIEAGQRILDAIGEEGMTDNLDQQAALYIEKARKTVKRMNERRMPVTKIFDEIRKEFTALENAIDAMKVDTVPYKLQQCRNRYAAKKRAEEEERRCLEQERLRAERARVKMQQDIEDDLRNQFLAFVSGRCRALAAIDNAITLDNYDASLKQIEEFPETAPSSFIDGLHTSVCIPAGVDAGEYNRVEAEIKARCSDQFQETYLQEVGNVKQNVLAGLPSKKSALERLLQASKEEAASIKSSLQARKLKDAEEYEAKCRCMEENARENAEMQRRQTEMQTMFDSQAVQAQSYQPKVKVSQKIRLLNPEGIMPVFSMWWTKEGCNLSTEELTKMFKRQITFCEKLATGSDIFLKDDGIEYFEDVKSK